MELILREEVYQIAGAAMEVHSELGNGFLEAVYQEALSIELKDRDIPYLSQPKLQLQYKKRQLEKLPRLRLLRQNHRRDKSTKKVDGL